MYILIEHNGTKESNNLANILQDIAEDDFGATCEFIIGDDPNFTIYNEDQKELIKFTGPRSNEDLKYILNYIIEEE